MNGITLQYKKPDWINWVAWPCQSLEEAERVKKVLEERGYQVKGI